MSQPIIVDFEGERDGDLLFVAGTPGAFQSIGYMRPMMFVHGFELLPDIPPGRRVVLTHALSAFAQGYIRNRPFVPRGCLFHIAPGNATMEAFARTLGGEPEPGVTYRIDYRS